MSEPTPPAQITDAEKITIKIERLNLLFTKIARMDEAFHKAARQVAVGVETVKCMASYWRFMATAEEKISAM
jgi:hypothetical protein